MSKNPEIIDVEKLYPGSKFIKNTIENVATKENMDTSPDQQWLHLDIGTAAFVACIVAFCLCFNYLIPNTSKIKDVAVIVALCITFVFPLTWFTSIVNYPNRNTKMYILFCISVGVIFQFVTLLITMLVNDITKDRADKYNAKLTQQEILDEKTYQVSPIISENNRLIYAMFTASTVLMIGSIATYFYDEVTVEKEMQKNGMEIKPGSTMGTNIHWWLTYLYTKANQLDDWWHSTMAMIPLPAIMKVFFLFAIGFLLIFFIFVDVVTVTTHATVQKTETKDYILGKNGKYTSKPKTNSPLIQNGVYILNNKSVPIIRQNVQVRYLPKKFDNVYKINYFVLLVFFTALLITLLFLLFMIFINLFIPFLTAAIGVVSSVLGFILSFCLLYFFYPETHDNQMALLYILICVVFALLSAPVALMLFEILMLLITNKSISQFGNVGWYVLFLSIAGILGYLIPAAFPAASTTDIFNPENIMRGSVNSSNVLQLLTVMLIAMTVGWFFGLSFHFDMFSFLFVLVFTPAKYVLKVLAPITILGLTITQVILASQSSKLGKKVETKG